MTLQEWEKYLKTNCQWLKDEDIILPVKGGHSNAIKFIIHTKEKKYFLKILLEKKSEEINNIIEKYKKNNIPIPKLMNQGYLLNKELYLCYELIEGENVKELQELSLEEYYDIGYQVGTLIKKLSQAEKSNQNYYEIFKEQKQKDMKEFQMLFLTNQSFFSKKELNFFLNGNFENLYNKYLSSYQEEKVIYGHNDIKQSNIMYHNKTLYLIDIENSCSGFFTEFLHADAGKWFGEDSASSKKILKGYIDGFWTQEKLPKRILSQLYFQILDFFLKRMIKNLKILNFKECQKIIQKYQYFIYNDLTEEYFNFLERLEINPNNVKRYVSFLKPNDVVTSMDHSHSGSYCFKIEREKEAYFLKIINGTTKDISRIKQICEIYKLAGIPTNQIIEANEITENLAYLVYDFKLGKNVQDLADSDTPIDYESVGIQIAKYMKNLNAISIDLKMVSKKEISSNYRSVLSETQNLLSNLDLKVNLKKEEWCCIENKLQTSYEAFCKIKKNIYHDDIKLENILMSEQELILIDIEGLLYHNGIESFRWAATHIGVQTKPDRKFYYGFLKEYHSNKLENELEALLFIYLLRVLEMIKSYCYGAKGISLIERLRELKQLYHQTNGFDIELWKNYIVN